MKEKARLIIFRNSLKGDQTALSADGLQRSSAARAFFSQPTCPLISPLGSTQEGMVLWLRVTAEERVSGPSGRFMSLYVPWSVQGACCKKTCLNQYLGYLLQASQ